jgi:hypothetical protein
VKSKGKKKRGSKITKRGGKGGKRSSPKSPPSALNNKASSSVAKPSTFVMHFTPKKHANVEAETVLTDEAEAEDAEEEEVVTDLTNISKPDLLIGTDTATAGTDGSVILSEDDTEVTPPQDISDVQQQQQQHHQQHQQQLPQHPTRQQLAQPDHLDEELSRRLLVLDAHRKFYTEGIPSRPEEADKNGNTVNSPGNVPAQTLSPDKAALPPDTNERESTNTLDTAISFLNVLYDDDAHATPDTPSGPSKPNNKRGMVNPAFPVSEDVGRAGSPTKRKVLLPLAQ